MTLVFGARSPSELPYFGPLAKVPDSAAEEAPRVQPGRRRVRSRYVQDKLREEREAIGELLADPNAYIYVCGLRAMEQGVEEALGSDQREPRPAMDRSARRRCARKAATTSKPIDARRAARNYSAIPGVRLRSCRSKDRRRE